MVDTINAVNTVNGSGSDITIPNRYACYSDTLDLYKRKAKECPKGVRLKLQNHKSLMIQFINPSTGKIIVKPSGETFSDEGIINAVAKCHDIAKALKRFDNVGDFWLWFDREILGKRELENNLVTYRDIFASIENQYYQGKHKNTGRKRSKDLPCDVESFKGVYESVFRRFPNWDKYPEVQDFKEVLGTMVKGTKRYKDSGSVLRKIAELSHDSKRIMEYLASIDFTQSVYAEKQSIDYGSFLNWYNDTKRSIESSNHALNRDRGLTWLWVTGCCVVYGLRPSEVMAAKNLTNDHTQGKVTFKAITDPTNTDRLLYLDEFTSLGTSTKTGSRVCKPLAGIRIFDELGLQDFPGLPSVTSKHPTAFPRNYRKFLENHGCPVTQAYAFRHLANQLGELNGIPQEIRARSLGHTVAVNDSVYKDRDNLKTTVDLLTNHSKQPLSLNIARDTIAGLGIDINDPSVELILKVIYQLD